ncbi:hypothetical protein [Paeniglutamicibacter terrestris]|uniref:DUF2530 domain-containing protein n=1 Tax=Paeniglutamicibacter terrestris TaxID=2723403 RepID=A0ABX1G4Y2_9MICC|nr:hypothetical protein [Paeniglutamicibacter terrestris]NKG21079.1 hypothetical protein [Paeniglutamicibacter terrestris]
MKNTILGTIWVLIVTIGYVWVGVFLLDRFGSAAWFCVGWILSVLVAITPFVIYDDQQAKR